MSKGDLLFARKIKELRREHDLSQQQLADMLGLRKTTISNYETGYSTPTYKTLELIMTKFSISSEDVSFAKILPTRKLPEKISGTDIFFYQNNNIKGLISKDSILKDSTVTLPTQLHVPRGTYIATQAADNSMNLCGIKRGTIIIINTEKTSPYSGQIFAAINNGSLLIRKMLEKDGVYYMTAQSSRIPTGSSIEKLPEDNFKIIGVVEKLIVDI